MTSSRSIFVPEVVQSSSMDCGPAALKSFLGGHGVSLSYGRLREACQTDVDGTSIETLQELSTGLGVPLEQVLLPRDAVLLEESRALPAIAVFRLPNGNTHFAVLWSVRAGLVQLMDPAYGRRWLTRRALLDELYEHVMTVPASDWRKWAGSEDALALYRRRHRDLGVSAETWGSLEGAALSDESWKSLGALDAALRFARAEVETGKVRKGAEAGALLRRSFEEARSGEPVLAKEHWSVRAEDDDSQNVLLRGAVLLRPSREVVATEAPLPKSILGARKEEPSRPFRDLLRRVRRDGLSLPSALVAASLASAFAVVVEGLLLRSFLSLPSLFPPIVLFLAVALLLDVSSLTGELRLGRRLENGLRLAFQRKLPRLSDRFFASRLTADMAERQHRLHTIRTFPGLARRILRESTELVLTAAAVVWLAPPMFPYVLALFLASIAVPLVGQPILFERDSRVRSHVGGLSRYYLDALLGLVPLRVHGAEKAIEGEHEELLGRWAKARLGLQNATVSLEALQFTLGYGLIVLLVFAYVRGGGAPGGILLLAYWALNLPVLGLEIVRLLWRYPEIRSSFVRVTEPLGAPDEEQTAPPSQRVDPAPAVPEAGAAIELRDVSVRIAGHRLLDGIDLRVEPGAHVAVVGASGAGKTSLFGVLLGFHFPERGDVRIDGAVLSGDRLAAVRSAIAWVDPAVQLWNRSVASNLAYGNDGAEPRSLSSVLELAGLRSVLESLPEGDTTPLGEGGGLVSGGEGQRVRLARALVRRGVRLALLDEPFRGLDRTARVELLRRTREHFRQATLLTITHDVSEAATFDRVIVLERGRLVEDGSPEELSRREGSHFRRLLDAERELESLWSDRSWRRWRLENGELVDAR